MAGEKGTKITASEFNELKNKLKEEINRRKYTGSIANKFQMNDVEVGQSIKRNEHYQGIINGLHLINSSISIETPTLIESGSFSNMNEVIDRFKEKALDSTDTGCNASCTGLCSSSCTGGCRGSCQAACANDCSGTCYNVCDGCTGCGSACSNNCSGSCKGSCGNDCNRTCASYCSNDCTGMAHG